MIDVFRKKLYRILRYSSLNGLWSRLAIIIIKIGGPKVAAYMSYFSIDWGDMGHDKTVLCLYRESFVKDIAELRKRGHINYPIVTGGFTRFQMVWLPKSMQIQTFYQSKDHDGDSFKNGTLYAEHLIRLVQRKYPVHAILSANFDYWQDKSFKTVCKQQKIPFLVLSREHPVIPKVCDTVGDWYRRSQYQFNGTAIAVAGRSTKDVILKAETICSSEQVFITGLPRYDAWKDVDTNLPFQDRPFITLLTFTRGYYADQTFEEILNLFIKAAKNNIDSGLTFLIKTKDAADTHYIQKMISSDKLKNLECSHESDLFDVLPKSRLVINYNSLSLIEAVMARASIVIPAWGDCESTGEQAMYAADNPKIAKIVKFAKSPEQLLETISASVLNQIQLNKAEGIDEFVSEFIHVPELASYCMEFERFVGQHITT
jgi:hypothetical protein